MDEFRGRLSIRGTLRPWQMTWAIPGAKTTATSTSNESWRGGVSAIQLGRRHEEIWSRMQDPRRRALWVPRKDWQPPRMLS